MMECDGHSYFIRTTISLILGMLGCVFAVSADAQYVNVDSLIGIEKSQRGVERMRNLYTIAKESESSVGRCIEFSLEGVDYGKRCLTNEELTPELRDSIIYYVILNYRYLTYGYYMAQYSNAHVQEERARAESAKILDCAHDVRLLQKQLRNLDEVVKTTPEILLIADKASLFAYLLVKDFDMAMKYADQMVLNMQEKGTPYLEALALQNKAHIYTNKGQLDKSVEIIGKALQVIEGRKSKEIDELKVIFYQNYSVIYAQMGMFKEAEEYILICKKLAEEQGKEGYQALVFVYEILDELYQVKEDYKKAYEYKVLNYAYKDSIFNNEYAIKISEAEAKYKHFEKMVEIETLKQNEKIIQLRLNLMVFFALMLVVAIVYSYVTLKRIKTKNKIIDEQRANLEESLKQTAKSIEYASLIQRKIMSTGIEQRNSKDDFFVINAPKQGVGGDFYYFNKKGDYNIIALADCTGHGVPGALLSVMCIGLLNDVLSQIEGNPVAHEVLEALRAGVKNSLNEDSQEVTSMSGMDMSLVIYKDGEKTLQYAGANRPLYLVHDRELREFKPVRNPLAKYFNEKPFETQIVEYAKGDMIYMFSDGITDQYSADGKERYGMARVRDVLMGISGMSIEEQRKFIYNKMVTYKGAGEQTDDAIFLAKRM